MSTLDVLVKARELVASGWIQGEYGTADGRYCMRGACRKSAGSLFSDTRESLDAMNALSDVIGDHALCGWNDAHGRTQAEVLEAFDEAIRREREANP